ncbi:MAG TPA: NUDIX hydrolase [Candidatus Limnocylindrales bacterium]|nr:NUDIX hydrolase [Candidatus Limnocylindrales bacterium]
MDELDWRLIDERPGSAGYLSITTRQYLLPNGARSFWDILGGGQTVAVVAVTEANEFVMVRQFRPGPGRVLLELPGGKVNDGEDPLKAAARELREETGYVPRRIRLVLQ